MNLKPWISAATLAAALCFAGCNSTKARISQNEGIFNSYPPQVQSMIRSNRIDTGFDSTQVYLALGNADRTESESGQQVWYYHKTYTKTVKKQKTAAEYRDEMSAYANALKQGKNAKEPTTYKNIKYCRDSVERIVRFEDGAVASWEEPDEMWIDEDWHR